VMLSDDKINGGYKYESINVEAFLGNSWSISYERNIGHWLIFDKR
jgi:hypothetical protein